MSNEPDEVNNGALATMIVLVASATLGVALVVTALVRKETAEVLVEKDQTQEREYRQLRADQLSVLTAAPSWSDRGAGLTRVPIDSAMEMVLAELRSDPYALTPVKPGEEGSHSQEGEEAAPADQETTAETGSANGATQGQGATAEAPSPSAQPSAPAPALKATPAPQPSAPAPAPKATPAPQPPASGPAKAAPAPAPKPTAPKQVAPAPKPPATPAQP